MGTFGRLGSLLGRGHLGTEADRTTFRTLHTASLAGPALRLGLTESSAERAVKHIHALLGAPAVALTDTAGVLAWDGRGVHHTDQCSAIAKRVVEDGGTVVVQPADLVCPSPSCEVRRGVVAPLVVEERVVGTLQVFGASTSAGLVRATEEVAQWVSGQLELAELDASRTRLMEAEVRALRAQISPHFIYNSLTAIASFVRTDPERARELLLEFADFTRYSFRQHGEFTTLAEELRSIDRYLMLERARFGDRLSVRLAGRAGGAAGGGAVPVPAAAGGERRPARARGQGRRRHDHDHGPRRRRASARSRSRTTASAWTRSGCDARSPAHPDSDSVGLGNVDERLRSGSATTTAWSSRPPPAQAPR